MNREIVIRSRYLMAVYRVLTARRIEDEVKGTLALNFWAKKAEAAKLVMPQNTQLKLEDRHETIGNVFE
jgi:hypothetical protein